MDKSRPTLIRLHRPDDALDEHRLDLASSESLGEICRAFERASGWPLVFVPEDAQRRTSDELWSSPVDCVATDITHGRAGRLVIPAQAADFARGTAALDLAAAGPLVDGLANLLSELLETDQALWRCEAELATAVPVVTRADDARQLAARLEAVLQAGAKAVGCDAAGLYLLDDATSQLKLRTSWQLPRQSLVEPARPLAGALADLEALLGHAVVLRDRHELVHWRAPEACQAAVCLPVSSAAMPLGTVWFFSRGERDFSEGETGLLELVAGRLAAELECEVLRVDTANSADLRHALLRAAEIQDEQRPHVAPLTDDWDLAGWTAQARELGGSFHDWFVMAPGPRGQGTSAQRLAAVVGRCGSAVIEPREAIADALLATGLCAALRTAGTDVRVATTWLARTANWIWTASSGHRGAAVTCATIGTHDGRVQVVSAGHGVALLLSTDRTWRSLATPEPLLGSEPNARYHGQTRQLTAGEVLLLATDSVLYPSGATPVDCAELAGALLPHVGRRAADLLLVAQDFLGQAATRGELHDRSVVVIKRRSNESTSS